MVSPVLAGVVLPLMLLQLCDVCAAGLAIDELGRGLAAHHADTRLHRLLLFRSHGLLNSTSHRPANFCDFALGEMSADMQFDSRDISVSGLFLRG
jgi:hypothetical protein